MDYATALRILHARGYTDALLVIDCHYYISLRNQNGIFVGTFDKTALISYAVLVDHLTRNGIGN